VVYCHIACSRQKRHRNFDAARHAKAAGMRLALLCEERRPKDWLPSLKRNLPSFLKQVANTESNERRSKPSLTKTVRRKRTTVYAYSVVPNFLTCNLRVTALRFSDFLIRFRCASSGVARRLRRVQVTPS
jgi:hypothetical protein